MIISEEIPATAAPPKKIKFLVVGLMVSAEYQQCQFLVNKLHSYYPDKYCEPQLRPMLNVDWAQHLLKIRRQHGGDLWRLRVPVAVFIDGRFLGDNATLAAYVSASYTLAPSENFETMGELQLVDHFRKLSAAGRDFVSVAVSNEGHDVGVMLLMLYSDLVPATCRFFLRRCAKGMWRGCHVVRVVKGSWVQFQGTHSQRTVIPCENYAVPHDRRGVVSMCNFRRHVLNCTDFHIALASAPWMDRKYVAFGLVVQGEEVLAALEELPTGREVPVNAVEIVETRPFVVDEPTAPLAEPREPLRGQDDVPTRKQRHAQQAVVEEVPSVLDADRYHRGLYCSAGDLQSHLPFVHLPERLLAYLRSQERETDAEEEQEEAPPPETPSSYSLSSLSSMDCFVNRSRGFLARSREDLKALTDPDGPSFVDV